MSADPKALYEALLEAQREVGPGQDALIRYINHPECPAILREATWEDIDAAAEYGEFLVLAAQARKQAAQDLLRIPGDFEGTFGEWYASASEDDRAEVRASFAVLAEGGEGE